MGRRNLSDLDAGATLDPPPTPGPSRMGSTTSGFRPCVTFGGASLRNLGKNPENQDAFVSGGNATGSKCFVGVFDGHGQQGRNISHFARDALSRTFLDHQDLHANPRLALEAAYAEAEKQIVQKRGAEAQLSGTTAVAAYQHRDMLLVANVGDSRAVLGRCNTAGQLQPVELSSDHKPSRADERQRIVAAGGKVDQSMFPMPSGQWVKAGPARVMEPSGMGGLAVSRSLGDLRLKPWVSSRPEIVERKLDDSDKFLVLGSDGIWDHISSKEAVDIVSKTPDPVKAAQEIAAVAKQRWHRETRGQLSDDITAVVVRLDGKHASTPTGMVPASRGHNNPMRSLTQSSWGSPARLGPVRLGGRKGLPGEMLSPLGKRSSASETLRMSRGSFGPMGDTRRSRLAGGGLRPASTGDLHSEVDR